ncbi:MAG: cell division protein FtsA [Bdellovibrionales bacterium]
MSKANKKPQVIAGLDVGTTKVTCSIGVLTAEGVDVVGIGTAPNSGMKQGVVVNIESTSEAIRKAKEEAELMAGQRVTDVWLAIGGSHVESFDSSGMIAIRNKEVSSEDIERVIEAAKAVAIPNDRQVLHVLPKDFKIDGQEGIFDPIGMSGVRLEASVHIITGSNTAILNTIKCTQRAGLSVAGLVLQQFASALAVLSGDEKNLGVSVIDIGGGTCDMITYVAGSVVHTAVIPVGGQNFTHDVAMGLKTTQINAETLKKKYGAAIPDIVDLDEAIEVESVGGRKARTLQRRDLCEILEARADETLALLANELKQHNFIAKLGSGVVLTGGGSLLPGLIEMGDFVLDVPVRRGQPERVGGLTDIVRNSAYATAIGLVLYGREMEKDKVLTVDVKESVSDWSQRFTGWAKKVKDLLN